MKAKIWNKRKWIKETNPDKLKKTYSELLIKSGFDVLNFQEYYFNPIGYTAIWMLAESHLAIHTFPEESKSYIELSSCNRDYYRIFVNLTP
jgi:S-adenosylmethionine/arginine decarboxylase-like enzyme